MILADTLNTVERIVYIVAAVAALWALIYARATVVQARIARQEAKEAHEEELAQETSLLAATKEAHEQELAERTKALQAELVLQRLTQIGRIAELLGEVADIGRREIADPPPRMDGLPGRWTRTTGGLARVEAAVVIHERLGGPPLPEIRSMSVECRQHGTVPETVVGAAMGALARVTFVAEHDESLTFPE